MSCRTPMFRTYPFNIIYVDASLIVDGENFNVLIRRN